MVTNVCCFLIKLLWLRVLLNKVEFMIDSMCMQCAGCIIDVEQGVHYSIQVSIQVLHIL